MDRVGGYLGYEALLQDARALDDVLLVMQAEGEAQKVRDLEAKARGRG